MKPLYLEFCGINSFSERAAIDFSSLLTYGIFGIFGDTGSGKSTILDCIVYALYGNMFRLNTRTSSITDSINYKLDRAYVNYEFEIVYEGRRRVFRVEREVRRKNALQNARVYEKRDGALFACAEGVRDCNLLLEQIIGLEQKDFEKCIALPQGEFAQFVKSARSDRLKLVSRLFDLEMYGEALTKRANAAFHRAQNEADILAARMEPYAELDHAELVLRKKEIAQLEEEQEKCAALLVRAKERERRITALAERKRSADRARETFELLSTRRGEMRALEGELSRLERAAAVVGLAGEKRGAFVRSEAARKAFDGAKAAFEAAQEAVRSLSSYDEEGADAEIQALMEALARASELAERKKHRDAAQKSLDAVAAEFSEEVKRFGDFSYEEERQAIEDRLSALGEGDFLSFVNAHGKAALFREEYGAFAGELRTLTARHPQIEPDSAPLIAKYDELSAGEGADYPSLKRAYEEREKARAQAQKALVDLETYRGKYAVHRQRLQQLQTEFGRLKQQLEEYGDPGEEGGSCETLRLTLEAKRRARREHSEKKRRAGEVLADARVAYAAAEADARAAAQAHAEAARRLAESCEKSGLATEEAARALVEKFGNAREAEERLETYKNAYAAAEARMREFASEDFSEAEGNAAEEARLALEREEERHRSLENTLVLRRAELARAEKDYETKRTLEKALAKKRSEAEIAERLKKLFEGNKFMEFVAEECLQNVAANAGARLLSLTGGRYFLRYDGGFVVGDNYNGGATRGVYTLSGGETFLVSLSLALALSAEICSKSLRPIEFFFLDEGFGTLDEHLVDVVLDSLEKLRNQHFSIGIISHVEELKHRIDKKLLVKKATENHGSQITAE